jgi:peptidoglycan/xylan/chitin deacetylase (PgdA/CDA1 family)
LLDLLKERNVKVTFFVVGIKVKTLPDVVKRMIAEGHEVGNHSKTHSWLHKNPDPGAVRADIESTQQILKDTIGSEPRLYRAPYLGYSSNVWAVLK